MSNANGRETGCVLLLMKRIIIKKDPGLLAGVLVFRGLSPWLMPGVAFGAGEGVNVLVAVGAVLARLVFEILGDRFEVAPVDDDLFVC